jgi:hypothetical protein
VVLKRARYFIKNAGMPFILKTDLPPENLKCLLLSDNASKRKRALDTQLSLFGSQQPALPEAAVRH